MVRCTVSGRCDFSTIRSINQNTTKFLSHITHLFSSEMVTEVGRPSRDPRMEIGIGDTLDWREEESGQAIYASLDWGRMIMSQPYWSFGFKGWPEIFLFFEGIAQRTCIVNVQESAFGC